VSHRLEALAPHHDLSSFHCGSQSLDRWLREHARHATGQGTRTYLLVDQHTGEVGGYIAIAPHLLARDELPARIRHGTPAQIPAILLAKLALDERLQGQGLGQELLIHALTTIVQAARVAGGRVVVVDAIDDRAARFYLAHDFTPVPANPHRLVMKLSTAAKALGLAWP
jgi:GNAT superfamily N-acetyltransferase